VLAGKKLAKYLRPIYEFLLFFSFSALVVMYVDVAKYLMFRKRPTEDHYLWCLGCFTIIWTIGGVLNHFPSMAVNLLKSRQPAEEPPISQTNLTCDDSELASQQH
jgi:hypothetical protein